MKPKNLAIGVAVLAVLAIALNFINKPAGSSGDASDKDQLKGRSLLTQDKEKLLESAHTVLIEAEKTLYLNDDDKNRSDLANFVLAEDAKKDDEVLAKAGATLDAATVAKLREKEVSSIEVRETVTLSQGAVGWLVNSFHGLPGNDPFDSEDGFLEDLRKAKIVRTAGKAADVAKKHETGKTKITFKDKNGQTLWAFRPGRRHDAGGRFAAVEGEDYAYHVQSKRNSDNDDFAWLNIDNDNDDWAQNSLLAHLEEGDEIQKIELILTPPPVLEAISLTRTDGKWTPDKSIPGKEFDESKATDLVDNLIDLRWSEALSLEAEDVKGAAGHYRKLVLHTKSLGRFQVQVGRKPAPPKPPKAEEEPKEGEEEKEEEEAEEDEPEPGPVITLIESLSRTNPLFELAGKTAFDTGESLYEAIPDTVAGFFKDPPPPPPPPPAALTPTGGVSPTGGLSPTGGTTPAPRKKITVATPPIPVPPIPKKEEDQPTPPPPPGPPPNVTAPPPPTAPPPTPPN